MNKTTKATCLEDLQLDFALTMPDDSMKGNGICAGDVVYLTACEHVDNGQTAAVMVGNDVFVRVFWQHANAISLIPQNPAYRAALLQGEELDSVEILGKVVAFAHIYPDKHPGGVSQTTLPQNDPGEVLE